MTNAHPARLARARPLIALLLIAFAMAADTTVVRWDCSIAPAQAAQRAGRMLVLPGVGNTRVQLAGFVERAQRQLPGFEIEVRTWGIPLLTLHNLRAYERNKATAAAIAAEIAAWRRAHPADAFYLVGYSGGGGIAALIVSALPTDIVIDRLILIAPAISPDYPIETQVLPHIGEFVVNFASERDLQVGWGTRTFGTIDRKNTASAGAVGLASTDSRVLQRRWSADDVPYGHGGNHLAYLGGHWQTAKLLPTIDPLLSAEQVLVHWAGTCEEE